MTHADSRRSSISQTRSASTPPLPTRSPTASRPRNAASWPRGLAGWAAWGLAGLLGLGVVLVAAGAAYQAIASEQDRTAYPPPGQLVDVGGHKLHLWCVGAGSPTVVTESGLGGTSLDWSLVRPVIAQTTRVCSYDRAGFGWSDAGRVPRTSRRIVEELHTLLATAGIPGPYVLVGHSVGGLHAQVFASRYDGDVAGLVLLDPTPAAYLTSLEPAAQRAAGPPSEQLRILLVIQPIGLTRLLGLRPPVPVQHLAPEVQQEMKALGFRSTASHALYEEAAAYETILAEAMGAAPLRQDLPVAVVSRGQVEGPPDQDAGGKAANADLARRFVHGRLVVAEGSGHFIPLDRPDLVIEAVAQIVDVIRGGA